ncbi:PsbP-related protein [Psychroserpens sp. MEBiC05023]
MKFKITTLVLAFLVTVGYAQDKKTIEKDGYSVTYPDTWESSDQKPQPNVQFLLMSDISSQNKDMFRENINMSTELLNGQYPTLAEYSKASLDMIKTQIPSSKIISNNTISVNGVDAIDLIWSASFGAIELKFRQYVLLKNDTAYIITYSASTTEYDDYSTIATSILNSFKFTK